MRDEEARNAAAIVRPLIEQAIQETLDDCNKRAEQMLRKHNDEMMEQLVVPLIGERDRLRAAVDAVTKLCYQAENVPFRNQIFGGGFMPATVRAADVRSALAGVEQEAEPT